MNQMAINAGVAAVTDDIYFKNTVKSVVDTREASKERFVKLGFNVLESKTNFLFVEHESKSAKDIFEYLKTKNIFVRYFSKPRIDNRLRVTIGTDSQMDKLFNALEELL